MTRGFWSSRGQKSIETDCFFFKGPTAYEYTFLFSSLDYPPPTAKSMYHLSGRDPERGTAGPCSDLDYRTVSTRIYMVIPLGKY